MSSYVIAAADALASASAEVSGIREAIRQATVGATGSTTSIAPAALDEVSAAITQVFGSYGHDFVVLSAQTGLLRPVCAGPDQRRERLCGR